MKGQRISRTPTRISLSVLILSFPRCEATFTKTVTSVRKDVRGDKTRIRIDQQRQIVKLKLRHSELETLRSYTRRIDSLSVLDRPRTNKQEETDRSVIL